MRPIRIPGRHAAPPASGISMTPITNTNSFFLPGLSTGLPVEIPLQTDPPPGTVDLNPIVNPPRLSILEDEKSIVTSVAAPRTSAQASQIIQEQVAFIRQHTSTDMDEKKAMPESGIFIDNLRNPNVTPDISLASTEGNTPEPSPPSISRSTSNVSSAASTPRRLNIVNLSSPPSSRPSTPPESPMNSRLLDHQVALLGNSLIQPRQHHNVAENLAPLLHDWRMTEAKVLYGYDSKHRIWRPQSNDDMEFYINRYISNMIDRTEASTDAVHERVLQNVPNGAARAEAIEKYDTVKKVYESTRNVIHTQDWVSKVTKVVIPRIRQYCRDEEFDQKLNANASLFALRGGMVLDLNTLDVRERTRYDYCTLISGVSYDPKADYKEFAEWISQLMSREQAMIELLQESLGYTCGASMHLAAFFMCIGERDSGKSSLFKVMSAFYGEYAYEVPKDLYLKQKFAKGDGPSPSAAKTQYKRFGSTAELEPDDVFSEAKLKRMSAGEIDNARLMRENGVTFYMTMKPWFHTNHMPNLKLDTSILKRLVYLMFRSRFMDNPDSNKPNTEFKKILDYEMRFLTPEKLSGILNWIIDGLRRFNARGRRWAPFPQSMIDAVAGEVRNVDYVTQWLEESVEEMKDYNPETDFSFVSNLFEDFYSWFGRHNHISCPIKRSNELGTILKKKYPDRHTPDKKHKSQRGAAILGLKIIPKSLTDQVRSMASI